MNLRNTSIYVCTILAICYACGSEKETAATIETETSCIIDNSLDATVKPNRNDHTTDAFTTLYQENVTVALREISVNQIPNHDYGAPSDKISEVNKTFKVVINPTLANDKTLLLGDTKIEWIFGLALNGCKFDPGAAFPYTNTEDGTENWNWVLEGTTNAGQIGLDENQAHLQANGAYHYHGDFSGYASDVLSADGSKMVQCGWAADGFPVYYKYAYTNADDTSSAVRELKSSYQLKAGERPGDGISAPCGTYNGKYEQDYEYIAGAGDLDACNGRTGVTPEFPAGTYYYVVTTDFPLIPRCFSGAPHPSFAF